MIKDFLRNIVYKEKASSEKYVTYLRKQGVKVGENVTFYSPTHTLVDVSTPFLLEIGDNVKITHGVIILTHDYSWAVLKRYEDSEVKPGGIFGGQSPVKIGNNVFIGMNAVITRGVTVGDNVIIGAGSVVTKNCEPDSVYAGNPAKRIMSIAEFRAKRESQQLAEAKIIAKKYFEVYGKKPEKEVFHEYFMLFSNLEDTVNNPVFKDKLNSANNYEASVVYLSNRKPMFNNYEDFLNECFKE